MAYADTPAGTMARQFFKQARRVTFVYHMGTWYHNNDVVGENIKYVIENPFTESTHLRPTASFDKRRFGWAREPGSHNGATRTTAQPRKAAKPSKKVTLTYTDKNGNLRKDAVDRELLDWCAKQGFTL